jgi:hypothetical protein
MLMRMRVRGGGVCYVACLVFKRYDDTMTEERKRGNGFGEVLAKPILAFLAKKFPDHYGAIRFIAALTRAHYYITSRG